VPDAPCDPDEPAPACPPPHEHTVLDGTAYALLAPLKRGLPRVPWLVLAVIAAGGVIGSLARYGLLYAFPHPPGRFAWAAFAINVSGCLIIGMLMVIITEARPAHRLARPFLATGVLGGYTSFSTYVVDTQRALLAGAPEVALLYAAGTVAAAVAAAWAGIRVTRALTGMPPDEAPIPVEPVPIEPVPQEPGRRA
jgi:CrcB protein